MNPEVWPELAEDYDSQGRKLALSGAAAALVPPGAGSYGAVYGSKGSGRGTPYGYNATGRDTYNAGGKEALTLRLKCMQRVDPNGRALWHNFCRCRGRKARDPNTFDEEFLVAFFDAFAAGEIPGDAPPTEEGFLPIPTPSLPSLPSLPFPFSAAVTIGKPTLQSGKAALVDRVKGLQRSDPNARVKWISFCESHNQKKHDPNFYDEIFLSRFFEALEQGAIAEDPSGKIALVQKVKEVQRKGLAEKQRWIDFCDAHGHGKHDPNMYDPAFLTSFIRSFEQQGVVLPPLQGGIGTQGMIVGDSSIFATDFSSAVEFHGGGQAGFAMGTTECVHAPTWI